MTFANVSDVTDITGLFAYNNTATGGLFVYFLVISLWFVLFLALGAHRKDLAVIPASAVTFIVCSVLVVMGVLGVDVLLILAALTIVAYLLFRQ